MARLPYLIVGAGPAGLQMAYLMSSAGQDCLVLESGSGAGTFFETFPRHGQLLSINRRFNIFPERDFNLRHDWNSLLCDDPALLMTRYSTELFPHRDELVRYLRDFAEPLAPHIRYNSAVRRVERASDGSFVVHTDAETYECDRLLMATGAVGEYLPDIEGIELADTYQGHSLDRSQYEGHVVAIIGAGNSAFEVANHLAGHAAIIHLMIREPVRHAWNTHFPGDLRAVNNNVLDMYELKSLHATIGFRVRSIAPSGDGGFILMLEGDQPHWNPPSTTTFPFRYDNVICCTGFRYVDETIFAPGCVPEVDEIGKYPVLSPTFESSIPGLYFLGTSMAARDRKAASPFIHGFRYNVRSLFHILRERYQGMPVPRTEAPLSDTEEIRALAVALIRRLSTAGSLYQQFGVLGDAIVLNGHQAQWYQALPMDHVRERADLAAGELLTMTLEYGFDRFPRLIQPLDFIKPNDPTDMACAAFLHPVFRHYSAGKLTEELHFGESLLVRYDRESVVRSFDESPATNPYVRLLSNFIGRKVGIGDQEPMEEPVYPPELLHWTVTPWTDEQRQGWQPSVADMTAECRYAL